MRVQKRISLSRERRTFRVANRIKRDSTRPRLSVYRSSKHIYAQIIDDLAGRTLVAACTRDQALRQEIANKTGNKTAAAAVGRILAQRAIEAGISQVAFDRRRYRYHGRVAALAEAARQSGLQF
jgi:large subunit ribosomal protein L18